MLDFLELLPKSIRKGSLDIYPSFIVKKSKDLMIRGSDFYAIWDEENELWSTDEFRAIDLIDKSLKELAETSSIVSNYEGKVTIHYLRQSTSGTIDSWHRFVQSQCPDNYECLDERIMFSNSKSDRKSYASHRLPYALEKGETKAFDELVSVLYSDEERHKIEWAIGSIVSGKSKDIQKFIVLYGAAGTGKSTILNIIQMLFDGYYTVFDAKALGSQNGSFALESFRKNPLIGIQHDGDLSRIEDNTRLNSLVSHELMTVNEKYKSAYENRFNAFLFMGTNNPVRITNAKSGLLRRLIDVAPTGNKIQTNRYFELMNQIKFELGAIAWKCRDVFEKDPDYYNNYIPDVMLGASNVFYNFVVDNYLVFHEQDEISLKQAWSMYKEYCNEAGVLYPLQQMDFKEELKNYFSSFKERGRVNGTQVWNLYSGFKIKLFSSQVSEQEYESWIRFEKIDSKFDAVCNNCKAQYATGEGIPGVRWTNVATTLSEIDTSRLHYVKPPDNHIVIDFDKKDSDGNKSLERNIREASKWPETYAELSKSGEGIHLHYIYNGDISKLSNSYDDGVEIKVFTGGSSLRRMLTLCTSNDISSLKTGVLPMKGEKKEVINADSVKSEKGLRKLIERNLRKEIHPGTKPSIDFIYTILEDAYSQGLNYDISDMRPAILSFAIKSTNHSEYCVKMVSKMKFKSEEPSDGKKYIAESDNIVFFDVEVFPNLLIVVWKMEGQDKPCVRMINPSPAEVEELMKFRLVGFNNRRYDNHILYARMMGYSNEEIYKLSKRITSSKKGDSNCFFGEAYGISYTDIYDFSSKKQSLKKFEIELGIHHLELGLPWDKPVPEEKWVLVADYCCNDVIATEAVWNNRRADFLAREILADLADMTVNDTSNQLTTKIIFGSEKNPELIYTDLSETFPGYIYVDLNGNQIPTSRSDGINMYMGEDVGHGGLVRSIPGMYGPSKTFDVTSQHPSSIVAMNMFGYFTDRFKELLDARKLIKRGELEKVKGLFGGKLAKYVSDPSSAKALSKALKIPINSVYGLTSASFKNPFKDPRNGNNIVALRGALFMMDLRKALDNKGYKPFHIKTDSCKVLNPTKEIEDFILNFGKKYGYEFEIEHSFDRICLVNDSVYIAKLSDDDPEEPGKWTATGTQFAVPYVFKTLFSHEDLEFKDFCETKTVQTALYLDMNENMPEGEHNYVFVGRAGSFCPMKNGCGGGELLRESGTDSEGNIKFASATGCKDYRWMESEMVKELGLEDSIDVSYYEKLAKDAIETISKFGDFEKFVSGESIGECLENFMPIPEDPPPFDE